MIDYENVNAAGMEGCDLLNSEDEVYLFYSASCARMRKEHLDALIVSGCRFHAHKLEDKGQNALDFYIAVQAGACFAGGRSELAIISQDNGFKAVQQFARLKKSNSHVILAGTIKAAIAKMNDESDQRIIEVRQALETRSIEAAYNAMRHEQKCRRMIVELLHDTKYQDDAEEVIRLYVKNKGKKVLLYRELLHQFGKTSGLELYRLIKDRQTS
ncbi:MAG: hypothetical protein IJI10_04940 [Eubacterium sp.]|nr:hypothetical protein [Eubacterium sp.]